MKNLAVRLLLAFFFLAPVAASAQSTGRVVADCTTGVPLAYATGSTSMMTMLADGRACVNAAVSASITGFHAESAISQFTATTGGVTSTTFTAGKVIVVSNAGTTNTAYCLPGVVATTQVQAIPPNSWFAFQTTSETAVTCITSTSTTPINVVVGTGLPTGSGGGGGGSGGGAVTVADGADVTQGALADAAVAAGAAGTLSAKMRLMTTQLDNINTNIQGAIPAQANTTTNIGMVNAQAAANGGATPSFVVAANSNNSTSLKGSAGTVYSIQTSNINASTAYFIKLYDKATAPTCGTDTPVAGYVIPPSNGGNNVTVMVGKAFALGIGYCIVTGIANNDNTSVPAATILANIDWK